MKQGEKNLLTVSVFDTDLQKYLVTKDQNQYGMLIFTLQMQSVSRGQTAFLNSGTVEIDSENIFNHRHGGNNPGSDPHSMYSELSYERGIYFPPDKEIYLLTQAPDITARATIYAYCLTNDD